MSKKRQESNVWQDRDIRFDSAKKCVHDCLFALNYQMHKNKPHLLYTSPTNRLLACLFLIFFFILYFFLFVRSFVRSFVRLLTVYLVCYLVSWLPGCLLGWSSNRLLLCSFVALDFFLLACFYFSFCRVCVCMYVLVRYTCIYVCYFRDLELRRGEVMVDCLTDVEDTKGNVSNSEPT